MPLHAFLGVEADGDVGRVTISAAQHLVDRTPVLLAALCDRQLADFRTLSKGPVTRPTGPAEHTTG